MEAVRDYFLSVTAAAVIVGIVNALCEKRGAASELVKLIAGLFLAIAVIRPLSRLELSDLSEFALPYNADAQAAAAEGEILAADAMGDIIKQRSEAYILDKAESLGLEVDVEVTLSADSVPVPIAVRITGQASPYARSRLESILLQDLGIAKEDQQWIG